MTQLFTRQATIKDIAEIESVLTSCDLEKDLCLAKRIHAIITSEHGFVQVVVGDDKILGVLMASFNGFHVFVSHIASTQERQQGIGTILLKSVNDWAKGKDARGIIIDSWLSSVGFFYKFGFRLPGAVFLIKDL